MVLLSEQAVAVGAFIRALDQLGHGVLLLEGERIVEASDTFCRLVGQDRAALLELGSVFELVVAEQREAMRQALVRYAAGERPGDRFSVAVKSASGDPMALEVVVKSVDPGSQPPRLLVVAQDLTDQRGVQAQLAFQSRMLEAIAEAAIDAILVVDMQGRMIYFNRRFVDLWDLPPDVVTSRSDEAALAAVRENVVDPDAFLARVGYLYEHPTEESSDEILLRDGRIVERYSAPVIDRDGVPRGRVWFFRDVSERRRAEAARELLAQSGELLGSSLDYETTLGQVAHAVVPLFADWAAVDVLDESGRFRRVGVAHVEPRGEEVLRELDRRWPLVPRAGQLRGQVVATRKPVALYQVSDADLDRLARDAEHRKLLKELGLASALWVPLIARNQVLGVISVGVRAGRRQYEPADLELLGELARRAALAIDNALLYRALDRGGRRQEALAAVGRRALAGEPLPALLQYAAERLAETLNADFSEVLELMPERKELRLVAGVGWRGGRVGRVTVSAGGRTQAGYTLARSEPVIVQDLPSETRFRPSTLVTAHDVRSGLTVVVGGSERPWGVLGVHSTERAHFLSEDANFAQSMADTLASAIERRRSEQELARVASLERARAAELKAVIESMGDAVVVCDAGGNVVLANPAAEALLGDRLSGGMRSIRRSFALLDTDRPPAVKELSGGVELRLVRGPGAARGRQRWMELSLYRVAGGDDSAPADGGSILVMRDITSTRDARLVRDAFLGILSHELRTPVTTIYGGAAVLSRDAGLDEDVRREVYADIRAEADRLYRLVENLLVLSRVEREGLQIEPEPVLLQRVLPRIVRSEGARWPSAIFRLDIPPGLPPVAAEETYLEQILQNLLGNAAKYGGTEVEVSVAETEHEVTVAVRDNGAGIDEEDAERLFDIFYRSPGAARRASGAGIGLFVSRQLVRAMNGRIWARNQPTDGAEFGFAVPIFGD